MKKLSISLIILFFVFISSQLEEDIDILSDEIQLNEKDMEKFQKSFKKFQRIFRNLQDTSGESEDELSCEETNIPSK